MKKLFILSILFSFIFLSCNNEPEPEPEVIRAYCYLYHFIPELGSVFWEVNDSEVPDEHFYGVQFQGLVMLETASEEFAFSVKHSGTKEVLVSQLLQLEKDKYYNVIVHGSKENPTLLIREIETTHPQAGQVKFQFLHSISGQNSIDLYMGGSTPDKRVVSDLAYLSLSAPFEARSFDAREEITVTAHSEEYNQDSVLLTSLNNDLVIEGANYLSVIAPFTYDPQSDLTIWLYNLPLE
jgi:hypothetical protein